MTPPAPASVLVVGTGLIGTSIGLALRGDTGVDVLLSDSSSDHLDEAVGRGAGRPWDGTAVDLAVVCTPPAVTAAEVVTLLRSSVVRTVSQVASVQAGVQREVEASCAIVDRYCGGHPMAGRERRGPAAATGRLFLDRPWVLCPGPRTAPDAVADVAWLASRCGAVPVLLAPEEHDRAVALVSHLPQVAASAVAAQLDRASAEAVRLAGPGVQDTTRVAASDPALWKEVLTRNAADVAPLVRSLADDLHALADALAALAADPGDVAAAGVVVDVLERGGRGRARLPLKSHPGPSLLERVVVDVPDEPGQLAAALQAAAAAGVNVEDLRVEHLPGRPRGLLELLVDAGAADQARDALAAAGFDVPG